MFNPKYKMCFLRNQKRNDKQPLGNFEAEIACDAKKVEAQPKKVVAYIYKKKRYVMFLYVKLSFFNLVK